MKKLKLYALIISMVLTAGCTPIESIPFSDAFGDTTPDPVTQATQPNDAVTLVPEPNLQEPEQIDFAFPQEFYDEIEELLANAEVNQSCTFDPTNPLAECGCEPEKLSEESNEYDETKSSEENGELIPEERVVSLYFKDMDSGWEYFYNTNTHYPVASIIKLPYIIYVCDKIDRGELNLDDICVYKEKHYFSGTGVIREEEYGAEYTFAELIRLSLEKSDNIAYEMLKDYAGFTQFSQFLTDSGIDHEQDSRSNKVKICAKTAGRYAEMLYEYLQKDTEASNLLSQCFEVSGATLVVAESKVYHKYGWANLSFHDSAFVDAPHPYVIGVCTNLNGSWSDFELVRKLSAVIEKYQTQFYEENESVAD